MKIGLLQHRILVKPIEEEETTAGGIIIPDAKEKPQEGEIIAVRNDVIRSKEAREARCQEWRPLALRRVCGHRGDPRRRGAPDHPRGRRPRHPEIGG